MAGVYKLPEDRQRKGARWRVWYKAADGRRRWRRGYVDKTKSLELARALEDEAAQVRDGLLDPAERTRRVESLRPVADQVEDYRRSLLAAGDTAKHARHVARALQRLLEDAMVASVAEIPSDRLQEALARLRAVRSARTANHALAAAKAFARWLERSGRIKESPRGISALRPYPQGKAERRRLRRALSPAEVESLLAAAEAAPPIVAQRPSKSRHLQELISGPDRAMVYRIALGTGFRASEIASLTPESFALEGGSPTVTIRAGYSKRGKRSGRDDIQPIRRALAEQLRPWLTGRPAGRPVVAMPVRTAEMLAGDLRLAGVDPVDEKGRVLDFHALRHSYISQLVAAGVNPKTVQTLARHSTITLTLDLYTHIEDEEPRRALEDLEEPPR
jgi:integrase